MPKCPRCENELREVLVTTASATRTAIEACLDGCAGIWVGSEDLAAGLEPPVSDELLQLQSRCAPDAATRWDFLEVEQARRRGPRVVLTPEQLEKYIQCIRCGREMMRYRWNMTSPVILDECPDGHGIWIDAGETMQMRQFHQADVADPTKRADLRARLAQVQLEYARTADADIRRPARESFLTWLFGILGRDLDGW